MFRHYQTDINYAKLIETQANQPAFGFDKKTSKKHISMQPKVKGKAKIITRCKNK